MNAKQDKKLTNNFKKNPTKHKVSKQISMYAKCVVGLFRLFAIAFYRW